MEEILDFIYRRWTNDANWLDGNCYWFAHILITRFPQLDIYYCPIQGHFIAGDGESFYDFLGAFLPIECPIKFSEIKKNDPVWHQRIVRDCVM